MELICKGSGSQFDPALVNHFLNISNIIKECLETKNEMIEQREFYIMKDYV